MVQATQSKPETTAKADAPKVEEFSLSSLATAVEDSPEAPSRVHKNSAKATSPFRGALVESWEQGTEPNVGKAKRVVIPDNEKTIKMVVASLRAAADGLVDHDPKLGVSIQVKNSTPAEGKATVVFAAKVKRQNNKSA